MSPCGHWRQQRLLAAIAGVTVMVRVAMVGVGDGGEKEWTVGDNWDPAVTGTCQLEETGPHSATDATLH